MDKKINVKICLGTTCFVMGTSILQNLTKIVEDKYPDMVEVKGVPCMGLCSIDWEVSKSPYAKVDNEIIKEATLEKIINVIESKLQIRK